MILRAHSGRGGGRGGDRGQRGKERGEERCFRFSVPFTHNVAMIEQNSENLVAQILPKDSVVKLVAQGRSPSKTIVVIAIVVVIKVHPPIINYMGTT